MDYKIPLWKHQLEAVQKSENLDEFAFLMDVGTGKTAACINAIRKKYEKHGKILKTLILAPPIVLKNWANEFLMHSYIPAGKITILSGSQKERIKKFTENSIFITNYESLLMKDLMAKFLEWGPEIIVADESHRVKNMQSQRTKKAIALADLAKYRYILSGSPILNSPMDIFSQFKFLDGGKRFGRNFYVFRAIYFYDKNAYMPKHIHFPNWQIKAGADKEISRKIHEVGIQIKKEDCLDLPPLVKQTIEVGMGAAQEKMYLQMEHEFIAYLDDKACVAQLALTKALRLQEIVSGYIKFEDDTIEDFKENPRKTALKELLEVITQENKVIIWACFRQNYKHITSICEELQIPFVEVHGDVPDTKKQKNVEAFQNDKEIKVFVGHPGSSGIGINLIEATYSIFYSRNFSLEHDIQAEARNYRGGSEKHKKITRIDLVCPGTVDELVLKKLALKQEIGQNILQDFRNARYHSS